MITLLHLSDLHIADTLRPDVPAGRWNKLRPDHRPHARGHDFRVARDLANECRAIRLSAPDVQIVITGDLTRSGTGLEFGCAHRFIHAYWLLDHLTPQPLHVGLGAGGHRALTIPGNHDFWGGLFCKVVPVPVRVRSGVLEPHFWPLPWVHVIQDPSSGLELHVIGLDSCSGLLNFPNGFGGLSWTQFLAQGAISEDQLDAAQKLLYEHLRAGQARGRRVLRVVLVHHPPSTMVPSYRERFQSWLKSNQIAVLLTGHTHVPVYPDDDQSAPPFELRCGTALQAGTYSQLPGPVAQHFYRHEILLQRRDLSWQTFEFWYRGDRWTSTGVAVWGSPGNRNVQLPLLT